MKKVLGCIALAVLVQLPMPEASSAQSEEVCAAMCNPCDPAWNYWAGDMGYGTGPYWTMYCMIGTCSKCLASVSESADLPPEAERVLREGSPDEVAQFAAGHRDKILLNPSRNLVVLQGGCDGTSPQVLVFVDTKRMTILERLGLKDLDVFLAERRTVAALTTAQR